jgi:hypothetical protein
MSGLEYLKLFEKLWQWLIYLWRYLLSWKFMKVFGKDAGKEHHIVYNIKNVKDRSIIFLSPMSEINRPLYANATNLSTINSCATTRAMGHLVYSFGKNVKLPPIMDSEVDIDNKMDLSFISIGGLTNMKTCDLLEDVSHFLKFSGESILWRNEILVTAGNNVDYAFIIKTHPKSNPERTWLCCAGVGEWGTSGAAWYLARKWKDVHKWAKKNPFAIITKTTIKSDETTVVVHKFLRDNDTGEFTKLT